MDEDEVAQLVQAQMDGEEWFGSMSYASSHLPTATNAPVAHLRTAKAWTDVMLTASDSSGEEDDEADLGDDTSTSSGFSEGSLGHVGISKPPTTTIPIEKIEKDEITSLPSPSTRSSPTFVVASRSSRGLRTSSPLISSARAKTADSDASNDLEPPPLLSSVLPATIEADLASTTASDKPEEDAPPRLPDVPDLPVLRAPSKSLRLDTSQLSAKYGPLSPLELPPAMSNTGSSNPPTPTSPLGNKPGLRGSAGSTGSPRERAVSHSVSTAPGVPRRSNSLTRRPSLYNPANLPNGLLQGELFIHSPQLPVASWINCECSLVGTQLRWMCKDPMCYGMIELTTVTKVTRGKNFPSGTFGFSITTPNELYYIATSASDQALLWRDAVEYVMPATMKKSASGSLSKKKSKDAPVSVMALATVKTRLDYLTSYVSTATFNLIRLFFHGKYTFIKSIFSVIPVTEADKVSASLARMFFYAEIPLHLIKSVIDWEVERTSVVNQLFRQDSIASKIMTAYTRLIAQPYLVSTLKTHVNKIAKCGNELEINPQNLTAEERDAVGARIFLVQSTVTELLQTICDSINYVPTECRLICSFLQDAVSSKFNDPKATEISLAGYLFLRLINPAIVVPDGMGLMDKSSLSPEGRRSLLLVSKIVLNMANQVEFNKEPHLIPFNTYLHEKLPMIQSFIAECAEVPPDAPLTETNSPPAQMFLEELSLIYRILYPFQEKMLAALAEEPKVQKRMKAAFEAIGPPRPANNAADGSTSSSDSKSGKKDKKADKDDKKQASIPLSPDLWHFVSKSMIPTQ